MDINTTLFGDFPNTTLFGDFPNTTLFGDFPNTTETWSYGDAANFTPELESTPYGDYGHFGNLSHFGNNMSTVVGPRPVRMGLFSTIIKVVYAIGIVGNGAAIVALRVGERRIRNRKHLLLLTSLAANDLVALVGMMCAMVVGEQFPALQSHQVYCAARVALRVFGIGSVCIAVTMALERYLALTRPFLYQKQVTYYVIRTALLVSWFWAAVLTCAPIAGLGLYYEPPGADDDGTLYPGRCLRYRSAETTTDFVYAIVYVMFGTMLCAVLVYCNLAVIRALYAITAPRAGAAPPPRRLSRKSVRAAPPTPAAPAPLHNAATAEEVAFSRLMATLSVLFMICWMPQMVTSTLYLSLDKWYWPRLGVLGALSDVLMLLNYVLNPILYVLMRRRRPLAKLCHLVARCFKRGHKTSRESMSKTSRSVSCCAPDVDTFVASSESGAHAAAAAELRPLAPHGAGGRGGATIVRVNSLVCRVP